MFGRHVDTPVAGLIDVVTVPANDRKCGCKDVNHATKVLAGYSVRDATSRITPSAVNNDTNVLMSLTDLPAAAYPDRMTAAQRAHLVKGP